jgi:hypothetical protein
MMPGAGRQVRIITLFRVITQTSADMHAGRTGLRTCWPLSVSGRREPGACRRLPSAVSFNGQGLEGNLREGAEAAWGG